MTQQIQWQDLIDGAIRTLFRTRNDLESMPSTNDEKVAIVKQILRELGD